MKDDIAHRDVVDRALNEIVYTCMRRKAHLSTQTNTFKKSR